MANASEFVIPRTIGISNGDLFLRMPDSNITIDINKSVYYREKHFMEMINELMSITKF